MLDRAGEAVERIDPFVEHLAESRIQPEPGLVHRHAHRAIRIPADRGQTQPLFSTADTALGRSKGRLPPARSTSPGHGPPVHRSTRGRAWTSKGSEIPAGTVGTAHAAEPSAAAAIDGAAAAAAEGHADISTSRRPICLSPEGFPPCFPLSLPRPQKRKCAVTPRCRLFASTASEDAAGKERVGRAVAVVARGLERVVVEQVVDERGHVPVVRAQAAAQVGAHLRRHPGEVGDAVVALADVGGVGAHEPAAFVGERRFVLRRSAAPLSSGTSGNLKPLASVQAEEAQRDRLVQRLGDVGVGVGRAAAEPSSVAELAARRRVRCPSCCCRRPRTARR